MEDVQKEEQAVLESIYAADFSMSSPREGAVHLHAPQDEDTNAKDNDDDYPASPAKFWLPVTADPHNINYRLSEDAKKKVIQRLDEECITLAGGAMIFSALDAVKTAYESLVTSALQANAPRPVAAGASLWEHAAASQRSTEGAAAPTVTAPPAAAGAKAPAKKDHLSKAQKRRALAQLDSTGERPRGWNWVDVVAHLSRTGSSEP